MTQVIKWKMTFIVFDRTNLDKFFIVHAKNEKEVWRKLNRDKELINKYGRFKLGKDGNGWDMIDIIKELK